MKQGNPASTAAQLLLGFDEMMLDEAAPLLEQLVDTGVLRLGHMSFPSL